MAHRQHKKPKLDATKVKQSDLADISLPVPEASDMDITTHSNTPDPDSLSGE
jgi:hypothetical protein